MKALNEEERERYQRHLCIPELGEAGQLKIKAGSVLVVGAGGLGSAVLLYLAAAGVGRLGIVDSDVVELSNLQRRQCCCIWLLPALGDWELSIRMWWNFPICNVRFCMTRSIWE
jgi:tRNA A37 threonylcarbamoyladenosine dehydratase